MGTIALALLGIAFGAAGAEFLRAKKPKVIEKIEDRAKRLVDSLSLSKKDDGGKVEKNEKDASLLEE